MSEKVMKWNVMSCESCEIIFAVKEIKNFTGCPECRSNDVIDTGEYLKSTLYTEDRKLIQKCDAE